MMKIRKLLANSLEHKFVKSVELIIMTMSSSGKFIIVIKQHKQRSHWLVMVIVMRHNNYYLAEDFMFLVIL